MKSSGGRYAYYGHTADAGLEAWAPDPGGAFAAAAQGLFALIIDPATVTPRQASRQAIAAADPGTLLVRWLNELLYVHEVEGLVFGAFEAVVEGADPGHPDSAPGYSLCGTARGERTDPSRHRVWREVKAATYHNLYAGPDPEGRRGYLVRVLFDL
jgi:SHS2 domain-containing protein